MPARAPIEQRRRICRHCSMEFFVKPSNIGAFCSRPCKDESLRTKPKPDPRPCVICTTIFKPSRKHGEARYCSKKCEWVARGGAAFSAEAGRKGRDKIRNAHVDRGDGKSYRKYYGRHEHRVVAERMLGRSLEVGEIVHHKDGDKRNNDPSNLEVMRQGEHMHKHRLWEIRWGKG